MATLTKVSPYRSGPPRFGNRPHNIDSTARTYQLTPEQLERLRAGENLDDILKEAKEMEQQKPKVIAYAKYEEVVAERDELKKQLEKEVEHWKELFETAMADKERLHKEIIVLENEIQRLKDVNEKREVIESLRKFERQVEEADAIERFLARLRAMAGTGNGIGETTVRKIRAFAEKEGFISPKALMQIKKEGAE